MALYIRIVTLFFGGVIMFLLVFLLAKDYFAWNVVDQLENNNIVLVNEEEVTTNQDLMALPEFEVVEVLRDLFVPWSIVFANEGRMLIAQRSGEILQAFPGDLIDSWQLSEEPLYKFEGVSNRSEEGLMGLTLHPNYPEIPFIYACVAYEDGSGMQVKIERLTEDESRNVVAIDTVFEDIPAARFHAGCRLRFGPDDKLYITTGDALQRNDAQSQTSLAGKLLRINFDGSIPSDNPFGNAVWSLGHRNSQGFDWHPTSQILVSSEHGPSVIDGPAGGDEINVIERGQNYGWPIVSHERSDARFVDPIIVMTPATAPASGVFYDAEVFPEFYGNFFTGLLVGEGILRVVFDQAGENLVGFMKLNNVNVGRVRDVAVGPDGEIYFSSSNRDGRGRVNDGDDKIFKIVPRSS